MRAPPRLAADALHTGALGVFSGHAAMNLNERVGVNEGVFERFKTEILYDMQGCRTSISDILTRLSAVETELSGVESALAAIVEVTT